MDLRTFTTIAFFSAVAVACDGRPDSSRSEMAPADVIPVVPTPERLLSFTARTPSAHRSDCLGYDTTVVLSGMLRRETHPGPPNYEDTASGDAPQAGLYLHLMPSVCTNGTGVSPDDEPKDSVDRIQLVLDTSRVAGLRPFVGRRVTLSGVLFSSHTGHHHAPLLLSDVEPIR